MLRLDFINVGYGDAILIRDEEYPFVMLIDCGDDKAEAYAGDTMRLPAAEYLRMEGITRLNVLVLSHMHRDHIFGLDAMLGDVHIDELWANYIPCEAFWKPELAQESAIHTKSGNSVVRTLRRYLGQLAKLNAAGCAMRQIAAPIKNIQLTPSLRVEVGCARPYHVRRQHETLDAFLSGDVDKHAIDLLGRFTNITSLRLTLTYAGKRVVLPGDSYGFYWEEEATKNCAILKLPHHGCKDSMTESLIHTLRPQQAVVCVSVDKPGMPDENILKQLAACGTRIFASDIIESQYVENRAGAAPPRHAVVLYI